jgi:tyrosyl-tRNA synthetase
MKIDNETLLERGVAEVIVKKDLEKKLASGKKLRIKLGIDPTGSDLHIGHAVVLNKLRQFQERGDTVILLIGDYTARIGDPTGKSETRVTLAEEQIKENMKHYIEQASKIIDIKKAEIRYNSEWFDKMTMADILELTAKKTVMQILQREDFKNRTKNDQDISMTEMLYPIMQGYDSIMLESDVEIGGTDQLFNMLVGRDLQKRFGHKTIQDVLTVQILEGLDGVEKMSKSLDNYIGITESPQSMYGKTMSTPDSLIIKFFELATDLPLEEVKKIEKALKEGKNPRDLKMQLARELVTFYHSKKDAEKAEQEFINMFQKKELPDEIDTKKLKKAKWNIVDLVAETGLVSSKSDGRRMVEQGGVKIDQEKVTDIKVEIDLSSEKLIQVGKRKFLKVKS